MLSGHMQSERCQQSTLTFTPRTEYLLNLEDNFWNVTKLTILRIFRQLLITTYWSLGHYISTSLAKAEIGAGVSLLCHSQLFPDHTIINFRAKIYDLTLSKHLQMTTREPEIVAKMRWKRYLMIYDNDTLFSRHCTWDCPLTRQQKGEGSQLSQMTSA